MVVTVAYVFRELMIVSQLGGALHHNLPIRLVLTTTSLMVISIALVRLLRGRSQIAALLFIDLLFTGLTYGGLLHYREFGALPSVAQLRFATHLADVGGAVFSLVVVQDLLLFGDILFLVYLLVRPNSFKWEQLSRRRAGAMMASGAAMMVLVVVSTGCFFKPWFGRSYIAGDVGMLGYHVWDAIGVVERTLARSRSITPEELERVRERLTELQGLATAESFGTAAERNVIVLQVESFQGFAAGLRIGDQQVTPHVDRIAAESVRFDNFFHITDKGRTSDAHFVGNCSLLPSTRGATVYDYERNELWCLPSILAEAGYGTYAFQALNSDFWNASVIDPKMGFQRSFSDQDFDIDEIVGMALSDRSLLRQVGAKLRKLPEPFYAVVLTTSSHTPYDTTGIETPLELGKFEGTKVGNFLHTMHYTDRAIGEFVEALRSDGMLDRSVLVIVGDHDAVTRRDSNLGSFLPIPATDEGTWFSAERAVASMIRLPGGELAGARPAPASQLDLAPTLLSLLGKQRRDTYFLGRDLLAPTTGDEVVVFPSGSALTKDRVYLSSEATIGRPRCFEGGQELQVEACLSLAEEGADMVRFSRNILDGDLIPKLRAEPERVGVR